MLKRAHIHVLAILLVGCSMEDDMQSDQVGANDRELAEYITSRNLTVEKTPHGFYYEIVNLANSGKKPKPNDFVGIYYNLKLLDGTLLDNRTSGDLLRFRHLHTALYPQAIDLGLSYMEKGDSFRFYIPSYLAYYDLRVNDLLPPFSNIIAEVTLMDVTDSIGHVQQELGFISTRYSYVYEYESGIYYKIFDSGNGTKPNTYDPITITYTRKIINEKDVDNGTFTTTLSTASTRLRGVEDGLKLMSKGDSAIFIVPSSKAYWDQTVFKSNNYLPSSAMIIPESFDPEIIIPPYSTLIYELRIHE